MENLTPMMKQYNQVKEQHKDCILFFRLGDFYEMFFEDAIETSKLLDITLTGRACGNGEKAPMCGVPYHSSKTYIQRLINAGKKVAICEQVQDPKDAKGIVKREIVKIITPATVLEDDMIQASSNNYIMSIIDNLDILKVSYVDITTGEVNNIDTNYSDLASLFFAISPSEIIADDRFYKKIKNNDFKNSSLINNYLLENNVVQNIACYDELEDFIKEYKLEDMRNDSLLQIYKYIHTTQKFFDINFFYEKYQTKYMFLDYYTLKNLEIIESMRKNNQYTLFWVLNKTNTSMGSRMLKQYLLRPLNDEELIRQRLENISDFVDNYSTTINIASFLNQIYDLERISNRIVYDTVSQRDLLNLKNSLISIKELENILKKEKVTTFSNLYLRLSSINYNDVINLLEESIQEIGEDYKIGHKIKSSYDEKLAYYRSLLDNSSDILIKMEMEEKEKLGIKNLKINYNKVFGYYIEISKVALQNVKLPDDYDRKQTLVSSERFINPRLKKIEEEMLSARQSEVALENSLYRQVKDKLRKDIQDIMQIADIIANIDVYSALSKVAIENDYVKPIVANDNKKWKTSGNRKNNSK